MHRITEKNQTVHFIGIGGIGISALAKYYFSRGSVISGSDLISSEITAELLKMGGDIKIGPHKKDNLPKDASAVIYTSATPLSNPELNEAKLRRLKPKNYAQALGKLTKQYQTITISGAHGKSTTTALAALVLEEGYLDPTVIVGTKVKEFGNSNFRRGFGKHLIIEADEWNRSFLNYAPVIAVVTNIDTEHLDTYRTFAGVKKTFQKYLEKVPKDGAIIANYDDPELKSLVKKIGKKVIGYSLQDKEASSVRNVLRIPGEHNVSNALAALRLGRLLGVCEADILRAISRFSGTWRRFELKGMLNGAYVFSDYGHHPREITATIAATRERFPFRRIWCVYQPHQYQRLMYLWNDFVGAFDRADKVCLLPVYDVVGRETKTARAKVNSLKLTHELVRRGKTAFHLDTFDEAKNFIQSEAHAGDVIIVMGAGDIYNLSNKLVL
ncbi:MAG: UDP-N-acetylmuramate--L-alanine ligase [Candidatus Sungiibacteriota bacterium]|uniref:UDP-N-acetylmuramate--L-alanine ligase n=1 Tax=Candidatus Sungiibacteriota bacterium TaxID=2750080 RepID=A0A7T5RJI4_9BACT|nr:MAG: UDP-N-acetylmuramate--L-alanine ligase [Candidatus Sungbacteria bacterium]